MRSFRALLVLLPFLLTPLASHADAPLSTEKSEFQMAVKRLDQADWKELGHFDDTSVKVDLVSLKYLSNGLLEAWVGFKHDTPRTLTNENDKSKSLTMDQGLSLDIWDCKEARSKRIGLVAMKDGKVVETFVMPASFSEWEPLTDQPSDKALKTAICGQGD